jgi:hypothetical protein
LTAKGHPLSPDRLAPEAMTAEILTLLGERGARLVDGVAYERELTADEIATLLGNDVSGDTKIGS